MQLSIAANATPPHGRLGFFYRKLNHDFDECELRSGGLANPAVRAAGSWNCAVATARTRQKESPRRANAEGEVAEDPLTDKEDTP